MRVKEMMMSGLLGRRCLGLVGQSELLDRVGQIRNDVAVV